MAYATVYLLTNKFYGTLYVGVTNDLVRRVAEHRAGEVRGFAHKYRCIRLVWFEAHDSIEHAIRREKLIKKWRRDWKINLIERENPRWDDLYDGLRP
jgi:putative endonuclease